MTGDKQFSSSILESPIPLTISSNARASETCIYISCSDDTVAHSSSLPHFI